MCSAMTRLNKLVGRANGQTLFESTTMVPRFVPAELTPMLAGDWILCYVANLGILQEVLASISHRRSSGAASKNFSPEHVPMTVELAANNLNQCGHHISVHGAAGAADLDAQMAISHQFQTFPNQLILRMIATLLILYPMCPTTSHHIGRTKRGMIALMDPGKCGLKTRFNIAGFGLL